MIPRFESPPPRPFLGIRFLAPAVLLSVGAAVSAQATSSALPPEAEVPALVLEGAYRHFENRVEILVDHPRRVLVPPPGMEAGMLVDMDPDLLDAWFRQSRPVGGRGALHLARFRLLRADSPIGPEKLAEIRKLPGVLAAWYEPIPETPGGDIPPKTPDFTGRQGYRTAAPLGISEAAARVLLGGRGLGVQVTDMESSWFVGHEDLSKLTNAAWIGTPSPGGAYYNHGTAVVGEICGDRNGYGITGIVDQVGLRVSPWKVGVANAISKAIAVSKKGDLILLEVHYRTSKGFVPAEYYSSNFNVIKTATSKGIHVVEAAGNGNNNLDDTTKFGRLFDLTYRDSGAIMAGATNGSRTARAGFSNYGKRITANGWGYSVTTTGYGKLFFPNLDKRQTYTATFNGTSSASPIVTGAVAALAGAVAYQNDRILTVNEVRSLLRKYGTPCTGTIGLRPDLKKLLAAVGLPDGLWATAPEAKVGGTLSLALQGKKGEVAVLFTGVALKKTSYGLNRSWHLDPGKQLFLGAKVLSGAKDSFPLPVPNLTALKDLDLRFQSFLVDPTTAGIRISSSTEVWLR